jgi:hypothetical protein
MQIVLTCQTCLQPVGIAVASSPEAEGPHYCSVHVPQQINADPDHPYFGSRVEEKPPVRMHVKIAQ